MHSGPCTQTSLLGKKRVLKSPLPTMSQTHTCPEPCTARWFQSDCFSLYRSNRQVEKKAVLFSKEKKRQSGARVASADLAQGTTFHGNGGSWESNSGQRKNETGSERGAKPDLGPSERQ